jgi:hypothetical protein
MPTQRDLRPADSHGKSWPGSPIDPSKSTTQKAAVGRFRAPLVVVAVPDLLPEVHLDLTGFIVGWRSGRCVQWCQELADDGDRYLPQPRHVLRVAVIKKRAVGCSMFRTSLPPAPSAAAD